MKENYLKAKRIKSSAGGNTNKNQRLKNVFKISNKSLWLTMFYAKLFRFFCSQIGYRKAKI
ncbi:hypothetical protein [Lactococcus formosensis]|uniref:hypothetical protein n=1 Tax=Lactococcus formosensis TaxID=1281486 RepID=UPI001BCEB75E|nr:hypothetical protein [Lactococcus formosensis]